MLDLVTIILTYLFINVCSIILSNQRFEFLINPSSIAFSFIPYEKKEGIEYNIFSNGKGALPCYLIFMYDIHSHDVIMGFDAQTKIINEHDVNNYHELLLKVLNKVIENPYIEVSKILEE